MLRYQRIEHAIEQFINLLLKGFEEKEPLSKLALLFNALPDATTQALFKKKLIQKYLFQISLGEPFLFRSNTNYGRNHYIKNIVAGGANRWAVELIDGSIDLMHYESGRVQKDVSVRGTFLAWSPDGNSALIQPSEGHLSLLDMTTVSPTEHQLKQFLSSATPSGETITQQAPANLENVSSATFSSDSAHIFAGSKNGLTLLLNIRNVHAITSIPVDSLGHAINFVVLSPCNRWLAVATENRDAHLYFVGRLLQDNNATPTHAHLGPWSTKVTALSFGNRDATQPALRIFLGMDDGRLGIVKLPEDMTEYRGEPKFEKLQKAALSAISSNSNGQHIVIGSDHGSIQMLSLNNSEKICRGGDPIDYTGRITMVQFITDTAFVVCDTHVATVHDREYLSVINAENYHECKGLAVNSDGNLLLMFNKNGNAGHSSLADYENLSFDELYHKINTAQKQLKFANILMNVCRFGLSPFLISGLGRIVNQHIVPDYISTPIYIVCFRLINGLIIGRLVSYLVYNKLFPQLSPIHHSFRARNEIIISMICILGWSIIFEFV